MKKLTTLSLATALLITGLSATEKRSLKNNMMEVYKVTPESANSLTDAFKNGQFYGRIRVNTFFWDWDSEIDGKQKDNKAHGIGGSLIYKTAPFYGVSATAGFYTTQNPIDGLKMDEDEVKYVKAGKDTFSRYEVDTKEDWGMNVLAQAYLQYNIGKSEVKAGRQIFESFLTKSNDTKMIPNTFEGISIQNKDIPATRVRAAFFSQQKLRDHTTFHDVITFHDGGHKWNNNDDSAIHKGLTHDNFKAAGEDTDHDLIVVDVRNRSIPNLTLDLTYGAVPDVVYSITGEANYKINLGSGYSLTPGLRYMAQFDDGAGEIGGATLKGGLANWGSGLDSNGVAKSSLGYSDPNSVDGSLLAVRAVLSKGAGKFKLGYSKIADDADIIAPWRGFPTGGYTRAMAQYNWYADTITYNAEAFYDFGKAGIVDGFRGLIRYAVQDFDEAKQVAGVQPDSNILHIDLWQKVPNIEGLEAKVRVGLVDADEKVGETQDTHSYNEYRFELNYLF
jgi:hypothetical protein